MARIATRSIVRRNIRMGKYKLNILRATTTGSALANEFLNEGDTGLRREVVFAFATSNDNTDNPGITVNRNLQAEGGAAAPGSLRLETQGLGIALSVIVIGR